MGPDDQIVGRTSGPARRGRGLIRSRANFLAQQNVAGFILGPTLPRRLAHSPWRSTAARQEEAWIGMLDGPVPAGGHTTRLDQLAGAAGASGMEALLNSGRHDLGLGSERVSAPGDRCTIDSIWMR